MERERRVVKLLFQLREEQETETLRERERPLFLLHRAVLIKKNGKREKRKRGRKREKKEKREEREKKITSWFLNSFIEIRTVFTTCRKIDLFFFQKINKKKMEEREGREREKEPKDWEKFDFRTKNTRYFLKRRKN